MAGNVALRRKRILLREQAADMAEQEDPWPTSSRSRRNVEPFTNKHRSNTLIPVVYLWGYHREGQPSACWGLRVQARYTPLCSPNASTFFIFTSSRLSTIVVRNWGVLYVQFVAPHCGPPSHLGICHRHGGLCSGHPHHCLQTDQCSLPKRCSARTQSFWRTGSPKKDSPVTVYRCSNPVS